MLDTVNLGVLAPHLAVDKAEAHPEEGGLLVKSYSMPGLLGRSGALFDPCTNSKG